jgi:hypothetical protein
VLVQFGCLSDKKVVELIFESFFVAPLH